MLKSINSVNNILFFGATGKLGSYWIKNLALKNVVFCQVHKKKELPKLKNIKKIKLNLINSKDINLFCKRNKISLIINCIGLFNVDFVSLIKKAYDTNYKYHQICVELQKNKYTICSYINRHAFLWKAEKKYAETNFYSL